jgi:hypothetical protein
MDGDDEDPHEDSEIDSLAGGAGFYEWFWRNQVLIFQKRN